jgi:hypothetical protein
VGRSSLRSSPPCRVAGGGAGLLGLSCLVLLGWRGEEGFEEGRVSARAKRGNGEWGQVERKRMGPHSPRSHSFFFSLSAPAAGHFSMASKASALLLALTAASLSTSGRRGRGLASAAGAAAAAAMATEATTANRTASATSPDPLPPPSYAHPGPCPGPPLVLRGSLITSSTGDRLAMTLTLPGGPGGPGRQAPWPVVAFFNGFQVRGGAGRRPPVPGPSFVRG